MSHTSNHSVDCCTDLGGGKDRAIYLLGGQGESRREKENMSTLCWEAGRSWAVASLTMERILALRATALANVKE